MFSATYITETAEKRQRNSRETAEKRQRNGRETAEKRQRNGRETAEKRQRNSTHTSFTIAHSREMDENGVIDWIPYNMHI